MRTITNDGVSITLVVNGQALEEYEDEESTRGDVASCYVEAIQGAHFEVHMSADRSLAPRLGDSMSVVVYLDGKRMTGRVTSAFQVQHGMESTTINGVDRNTTRGAVLERFTFAHLQTSKSQRR